MFPARIDLFDSMKSPRPIEPIAFGLGLYVVRVIAEHHGGVAKAVNLTEFWGDDRAVAIS